MAAGKTKSGGFSIIHALDIEAMAHATIIRHVRVIYTCQEA